MCIPDKYSGGEPRHVYIVRRLDRHAYSTVSCRGSQLLSTLFGLYQAALYLTAASNDKFNGDSTRDRPAKDRSILELFSWLFLIFLLQVKGFKTHEYVV